MRLEDLMDTVGFERVDAETWALCFPDGNRWIKIAKELNYFVVNFNDEKILYHDEDQLFAALEIFEEAVDS
jgi:hypothetical protein